MAGLSKITKRKRPKTAAYVMPNAVKAMHVKPSPYQPAVKAMNVSGGRHQPSPYQLAGWELAKTLENRRLVQYLNNTGTWSTVQRLNRSSALIHGPGGFKTIVTTANKPSDNVVRTANQYYRTHNGRLKDAWRPNWNRSVNNGWKYLDHGVRMLLDTPTPTPKSTPKSSIPPFPPDVEALLGAFNWQKLPAQYRNWTFWGPSHDRLPLLFYGESPDDGPPKRVNWPGRQFHPIPNFRKAINWNKLPNKYKDWDFWKHEQDPVVVYAAAGGEGRTTRRS